MIKVDRGIGLEFDDNSGPAPQDLTPSLVQPCRKEDPKSSYGSFPFPFCVVVLEAKRVVFRTGAFHLQLISKHD